MRDILRDTVTETEKYGELDKSDIQKVSDIEKQIELVRDN